MPPSTTDYRTVVASSQGDYTAPTLLQNTPAQTPPAPQYMLPLSPAPSQQTYSQQSQMLSAPTLPAKSQNLSGTGTQGMDHHTSRRGALGWILGGITVVGLGIGRAMGIYINENHSSSNQGQQSSNSSSTSPSTGQQPNMLRGIQYILNGHSGEVTNLSWSPDGTQLASASLDHSVRLWNSANQQNTTTYMGHTQAVLTVAWSHHSYQLASGGQDNRVLVWDTAGNTIYNLHQPGPVEEVIWTPNDQHIIVDIHDHKVQEIALSSNKPIPIGRVFANYSLSFPQWMLSSGRCSAWQYHRL